MPDPDLESGTILVVDDTPANLGVVLDFLGQTGFEVLVAESGAGALEQLEFAEPDIILLDVRMPGMDGLEVCRQLKAADTTRHIPVIFMTALTDTGDKVAGFSVGAVDYVTKPVQPEEVLMRIKTHLEIRRLQRELEEENALRRDAEEQLQESLEQAVVVATRDLTIRFCTRFAWDLIHRYIDPKTTTHLPAPITEWMAGAPTGPLVIEQPGSELVVRLFSEGGTDNTLMLLMEERVKIAGPEPLQQLGLTPREAEVLYWLTQGKTSPEIAIILEAAPNTVKKHVQNIFQKLEVENRTAAALKALEVLGLPPAE